MVEKRTLTLHLDRDVALVLSDFLWREVDDRNASRLKSATIHEAELWALSGLLGHLDKALDETFAPDYADLVAQARAAIVERTGGWPD